ncbi:PhoH family protein [Caldivirga maquilingensis]|uniref:PhoH-like protein n=1 Tax=Caldivirga maquilingensis (strain ATCC 700844 / DSM 13496 / JCM 10307 / IC-167) TaxID=397948 RepID=A8MCD1_CALMQ|nr:PhoH family protein [Caldivirga maquilingensis IC-167]
MMSSLFDNVKPLTMGQERLINVLKDDGNEVVGAFGPTGTGKSFITVIYGISAVLSGRFKRLIIARPLIDITSGKLESPEELGDLYYRVAGQYLYDILGDMVPRDDMEKMLRDGRVIVTDVSYLRGRTFDESVILLDDAQHAPPENAAEVLMRMGRNARLIIAGDPILQRPLGIEKDGATLMREVLLNEEKAMVVDLGLKDIIRPGAKRGLKLMFELRLRRRSLNDDEKKLMDVIRVHAPDADVVTVVGFRDIKENLDIKSENAPDALIVAKEGYLGRVVGKGGERIKAIENDSGFKLIRTVEMSLDFKQWIRTIHPISWIIKHIVDVDFAGPELQVILRREMGAFVGPKGTYIRLLDRVFKRLLNIGVRAIEEEQPTEQ